MGFNLHFLKDFDTEAKAIRKVGRGAKKVYKETENFSNAVIDRSGGAIVRGGIRLGALVAEPLPGEQRKAAREFISKYAENEGEAAKKTGVGRYDEQSTGGKLGRKVGTTISVGTQLTGIGKVAGIGGKVAGTNKVMNFLGRSVGGSIGSTAQGIAQDRDVNLARELGTGLAFDVATLGLGKGFRLAKNAVKPVFADESELFKQLAKESTQEGIKNTLKKAGLEADNDVVSAIASNKDPNIIRNLVTGERQIAKEVPVNVPPPQKPVAQNLASAPLPSTGKKTPQVIARSPSESPELVDLVKRGKLQKSGDVAPIDSLKLGSDVKGGYDAKQITKYIDDIKQGRTIDPIIIDSKGFVQDGKHRLEAMRQLGVKDVPVVQQIDKPKLSGAAQQSSLAKTPGQDIVSATVPNISAGRPFNKLQSQIETAHNAGNTKLRDELVKQLPPDLQKGMGFQRQLKPVVDPLTKKISMVDATVPKAVKSPEVKPVDTDPFEEINKAITGQPAAKGQAPKKSITKLRAEQEAMLSRERGARFAKSGAIGKETEGSAGYFAEKSALKGSYGKVEFSPLVDDIGPERAEELFSSARRKIVETPDTVYEDLGLHPGGARLNTQTAVRKVLGLEPGLPTKSEIKLLSVYSPKLADQAKNARPLGRKIFDAAATLFGNSRAAKSTLDLSMGGRQGLFVAARHPVQWIKANKESVKYAKNPEYFKNEMKAIHGDEWGQLIDRHNPSLLTGGRGHEEAYTATDIVGKVPGVKAAERAYTGGLTKLRKDILTKNLQAYGSTAEEAERALGKKGMEGLLEAVGTLTGRGGKAGGFVSKHATTLQEALFSPRLWASRLQPLNPVFWKRIGPAGRKEAMESLGSFAAVAGTVLAAAVAAGAEVETDPRSSDFLKIKVGDTRYDILGGFQQNLVFGARQLTGETKSSQTGKVTKFGEEFGGPTRLTSAFDLVRNKANPVLGSAANILEGKDKAGNKVNIATEIGQLFVPIGIQNAFNARQDPKEVIKGAPEFVGIGSQTYGLKDINITEKQKEMVNKISDPAKKEGYTRFYQTLKSKTPDKDSTSKKIKEALTAGDKEKAKALAREYNKKYEESFKDWREQYGDYRSDKELVKEYKRKRITSKSLNGWLKEIKKGETP